MTEMIGIRIQSWKSCAACFSGAAAGCSPMPPGVGCPINSSANAWTPQNADVAPVAAAAAHVRMP